MRIVRLNAAIVALAILLSCGFAHAETKASLPEIRDQQTSLRAQVMSGDGAFKDMEKGKRRQLADRQGQLLALIEGKDSVDQLNERQKTDVFNMLEEIKAAVTNAEDGRMICERTRATGSHRVTRVCSTVAERRAHREGAEKMVTDRPLCWDGCGKSPDAFKGL